MRNRNWFWALFFVGGAVLIIANQFLSFPVSIFKLIATIFWAAIMIDSIPRRNFFGIFVPAAFLVNMWVGTGFMGFSGGFRLWPLFVAAVFLSIGLSIVFPRKGGNHHFGGYSGYDGDYHGRRDDGEDRRYHGEHRRETTTGSQEENNVICENSFGAKSHYLYANALESGRFSTSFGELKVYFDQAKLSPNGAQVQVDCSLGSMELYIPREWNVVNNLSSSLGSVTENYRGAQGTGPALILTGGVSLGGIQIFYV